MNFKFRVDFAFLSSIVVNWVWFWKILPNFLRFHNFFQKNSVHNLYGQFQIGPPPISSPRGLWIVSSLWVIKLSIHWKAPLPYIKKSHVKNLLFSSRGCQAVLWWWFLCCQLVNSLVNLVDMTILSTSLHENSLYWKSYQSCTLFLKEPCKRVVPKPHGQNSMALTSPPSYS